MKRKGFLYDQICKWDNILLADRIARKRKKKQKGIKDFDRARGCNLLVLHNDFLFRTYNTSPYIHRTIYEPKQREITIAAYRDRVAQHMIINVIGPIFHACFTRDSYCSIKGRGIHNASYALRDKLRNLSESAYYLKMDVVKFYPSVKHDLLKAMLLRKFKDVELLKLLYGIIDSAVGLPIGNFLSLYLANFYLTGLDRHIKNTFKVNYYRYCDDIVIPAGSKKVLHQVAAEIITYCNTHLNLVINSAYRIAPIELGINWVGYVHYSWYALLRPEIKRSFARAIANGKGPEVINSYLGWAKHCNSKNLIKTLIPNGITTSKKIQRLRDHP